jgi:hypothetical protein
MRWADNEKTYMKTYLKRWRKRHPTYHRDWQRGKRIGRTGLPVVSSHIYGDLLRRVTASPSEGLCAGN